MINKQILQHRQKQDKGGTRFFVTLALLLSLTVFILAMNSTRSDSEVHPPIASLDDRMIEPQSEMMGPLSAMGGALSELVEPQMEMAVPLSEGQSSHAPEQSDDTTLALTQPVQPSLTDEFVEPVTDITYTYTIKTGDTFSHILEENGHYDVMRQLIVGNAELGPFNALVAGRKMTFTQNDGVLSEINYQISPLQSYKISYQEDGGYRVNEERLEVEQLETHATVEIVDSLYLSAKRVGLSDKLIIAITNIMEWDIDFAYDVRKGDHFSVIYYENYVGNEKIDEGPILALRFTNRNEDYRIVRYTDSKGNTDYYFLDGKKVRKAFLRNPLEFAYISSRFNPRRMHPVLHKVRAHNGVDYAARRGTPVRAAGDGRVSLRQYYSGYGNTVILHHGGGYSTLYAHLSKFADRQRVGSWVKQGQVIGYVGSTGLSTGPHLHYEFRVNGVHKNPLTVKLPDAVPLAKSELPRFNEHIKATVEKLHLLDDAYIASKNPRQP
ncbi:MAG: peptidoglycan DD-metalloendopeptidase family protein [Gammaproteobacteria bacterium]|nr:peptidoglycan DD-metalloendopeptidase family protein [Gammaproteobacteria bacterium]